MRGNRRDLIRDKVQGTAPDYRFDLDSSYSARQLYFADRELAQPKRIIWMIGTAVMLRGRDRRCPPSLYKTKERRNAC